MNQFNQVRRNVIGAALLACGCFVNSASAAVLSVYTNDFDGNTTTASGVTANIGSPALGTASGGPYNGSNGKSWNGQFLQNTTTGNPATATVLQFSNLPTHSQISVDFLLGFIDSWDSTNGSPAPDELRISIDGSVPTVLTTVTAGGSVVNYAGGNLLVDNGQIDSNFFFSDDLVDMANAGFLTFAHSASSLTLSFQAGGAGWQGGADESWGIDALRITAVVPDRNGGQVPVPGVLALLGIGGMAAAFVRRRKVVL